MRKRVDNGVHTGTRAIFVGIHHFARNQGYLGRVEVQVPDEIVIDGFNLVGPIHITCVRLALVQQNTFNDACLLCQLCHIH